MGWGTHARSAPARLPIEVGLQDGEKRLAMLLRLLAGAAASNRAPAARARRAPARSLLNVLLF